MVIGATYTTKIRGCPFVVKDALIGVCDSCGSKHFIDTGTQKWVRAFEEWLGPAVAVLSILFVGQTA